MDALRRGGWMNALSRVVVWMRYVGVVGWMPYVGVVGWMRYVGVVVGCFK